jgi:hypothetical protein
LWFANNQQNMSISIKTLWSAHNNFFKYRQIGAYWPNRLGETGLRRGEEEACPHVQRISLSSLPIFSLVYFQAK